MGSTAVLLPPVVTAEMILAGFVSGRKQNRWDTYVFDLGNVAFRAVDTVLRIELYVRTNGVWQECGIAFDPWEAADRINLVFEERAQSEAPG